MTRVHDLLDLERDQRLAVETKLAQAQRVNATLLIVRGRFEAACEELARLTAEREDVRRRLEDVQRRLNNTEQTLLNVKVETGERIGFYKKKLASTQELFQSREKIVNELREDRLKVIGQRDKLQELSQSLKKIVNKLREDRLKVIGQRDKLQELSQSREKKIIELHEDALKTIGQRDKLKASVAAIREDRALRLEERENRIKELSRSVKRLEKKVEKYRQFEREREAESQAPSTLTPAKRLGSIKLLLRSLIPGIERQRLRKSIELVKSSGLFDASFYLERYQDLRGDPSELLEHYVQHGGSEGRAPSAAFNGSKYLQRYPDVKAAGLNPLVHFLECGKDEGRTFLSVIIPKNLVASSVGQEPATADAPDNAEEVGIEGSDTTEIEFPDVSASDVSVDSDCDTEIEELIARAIELQNLVAPSAAQEPATADAPDNAEEVGIEGSDTTEIEFPDVSASDVSVDPDCDTEFEELSAPAIEPLQVGVSAPQPDSFSALAIGAANWLRSSEMPEFEALRVGDIAVAFENQSAGMHSSTALQWFDTLNCGSTADAVYDAKIAVRKTLYDDRLIIEDAWLSSDFRLRIRLSVLCGDPLVIRCCQQAEDGAVLLCTEQSLVVQESNVLDITLASRFTAILLVFTDRQGRLIDSTLLPFPTLLRGGIHHGELIDFSSSATGWAAHETYASNLLIAFADQSRDFAVGDVSVALGNANGTEPIFSKSFRQWLSQQFKIDVTANVETVGNNPALRVLSEQMRAPVPFEKTLGRTAGRTLLIGANTIPSLGVLLAHEADLADATAVRTIVVDELTRRPLRAVDHPIIDCGRETLLQQSFEPALLPGLSQSARVTVISISFIAGDIYDVRAAFPVAGDVVSAISELIPAETAPISAIIDCSGSIDGLSQLLASLARQQSVSAVECLLIGTVPDADDSVLIPFDADRPMTLVRTGIEGGTTLSRLHAAVGQATHDSFLLVDDKKVLHDPRTLNVLSALCARDEIGTAGCQVVNEISKKNGVVEYKTRAGYVPLSKDRCPAVVTRPHVSGLALPLVYPVLANPIRCLIIKRELWPFVASDLDDMEVEGEQPALVLGIAMIECGKLNIATSLVSISDCDETSSANVEAPWLAMTPTRFISLEEY